MTAGTVSPGMHDYGNSFGKPHGANIENVTLKGDILSSSLGETTLQDVIEFNKFEEQIKSFILGRLGFPVVRVELTDFMMKTAIDEALAKMHNHAPNWATQLLVFKTTANINIYELPQYVLDNIKHVSYKKNLLGIPSQGATLEQDYFLKYFQSNFLFNDFSIGEYYLLQISLEMMRKVLGQDGSWEVLNNRYLQVYPTPTTNGDDVIVEYLALDSGTIHPAYKNWIQKYALAISKGILGQVRSKYAELPGPTGGARLNGESLITQSEKEIEKLDLELINELEEPPGFYVY